MYRTRKINSVLRLSYDGNQLLDEKTLADYGIKGGTVQVNIRNSIVLCEMLYHSNKVFSSQKSRNFTATL